MYNPEQNKLLRAIQSWFYTIVFMLHMENP